MLKKKYIQWNNMFITNYHECGGIHHIADAIVNKQWKQV